MNLYISSTFNLVSVMTADTNKLCDAPCCMLKLIRIINLHKNIQLYKSVFNHVTTVTVLSAILY